MAIEVAVLAHIMAAPAVIAVVGTRGYQLKLPENPVLPALRMQLIDEPERVNLQGDLTNLFQARIQVDLWARESDGGDGYTVAREGGVAVRNAMVLTAAGGQVFTVAGSPAQFSISSVQTLDKAVDYEANEIRAIRMRQDFGLMFQELS